MVEKADKGRGSGEEPKGSKRREKAAPKPPPRKGSLSGPGLPSVRLEDVLRLLMEGRTPREIERSYRGSHKARKGPKKPAPEASRLGLLGSGVRPTRRRRGRPPRRARHRGGHQGGRSYPVRHPGATPPARGLGGV